MQVSQQHRGPSSMWGDWLMALVLAGLSMVEIWVEPIFQTGMPGPRGAVSALALLGTVPLVWRRTRPLAVLVVLAAALAGLAVVADPDQASFEPFLAMLIACYTVAAYRSARETAIAAVIVFAVGAAYEVFTFTEYDAPVDIAVSFFFLGAAFLIGIEVSRQRTRVADLAERASLLADERDRRVELATAEERVRIARELHDAVAHSVGLSVMHVGAARLHADDPERSRELMITAEARGREALAEMRQMLGILRSDDGAPLAPVPSLRQLDDLVERMDTAGLAVNLEVDGDPARLSPGLDQSAYRITQESLTNALKHGSEPRANVVISYRPRELTISVTNPSAERKSVDRSAGHGLVGIEERVRLFDGTVDFGDHDGEWSLDARLPLEGYGR